MLAKPVLLKSALLSTAMVAIVCGWFQLLRFSTTDGEQSVAPAVLPAEFFSLGSQPLLLVFVHPQCSCTAATFQQLDRLLSQSREPLQIVLAVYDSVPIHARPPIHPEVWIRHPYRLLIDTGGSLARRFGAATSGEILLYSSNRQLLFQGGITAGRAHSGDNLGSQALLTAIDSGQVTPSHSPVFGCPIFHLAHLG